MTKNNLTVSAIAQKGTTEKVSVVFSDGSEIPSTVGAVTDFRLFPGKTLSDEELLAFKEESSRFLALNKAVTALSYRSMSCRELQDKLKEKGIDEETALYCVDKLTETGLLQDDIYAQSVVRHCLAKGYGSGRILAELRRRGISEDLIESSLSCLPDSQEPIAKFLSVHLKDSSDPKQVKKAADALFRRGYSWDDIKRALRTYEE